MAEKVFQKDEMLMRQVDEHWDRPTLLSQDGVFFLKDVVGPLNLKPYAVKNIAKKMKDSWAEMGVRKMWTHWIVRMKVFSDYYQKHLMLNYQQMGPEPVDANEMLALKGTYKLSDVCRSLPITTHQVSYQARSMGEKAAKKTMGVKKEGYHYVVDMEIFSKWVASIWNGDFGR